MIKLIALAGLVVAGGFLLLNLTDQTAEKTLAEFTTPLGGRTSAQRHNATLVSQKIDGQTIMPGETFSFNKIVGSWSRDRGYRRAPVSYGGQLIDAWGGGVCQTSTTLYNAALLAGMDVDERASHHYAPDYIAPGRDAAVAFPNIDLKITNPYSEPVMIEARVKDERLVVSLTGRIKELPEVSIVQRKLAKHEPRSVEVGRGGAKIVRNIGKPGFEVETFRVMDGKRQLLNRDVYPVMNRVVERRQLAN